MAEADRGRESGVRVFKAGRIRCADRMMIDCVIRYLTPSGAELYVINPGGLPDMFELIISPVSPPRLCHVTGIENRQVQVQFESA